MGRYRVRVSQQVMVWVDGTVTVDADSEEDAIDRVSDEPPSIEDLVYTAVNGAITPHPGCEIFGFENQNRTDEIEIEVLL